MERRLILTGALALAAAPALAQSNPPPPTDPAAAPAMKMAAPTTMSDAAATHLKGTMEVGSLSLATSRIAADKVRHAALKQFTGFEIAEQETIASILKAMMMPGAPPSGTVKPPTDAELMGNLDDKGRAAVTRMHEMKAGAAFDRDYVKSQIEGHRKLLALQEAYLAAPTTVDETNVAKLAKGMIIEHLALLAGLEKEAG